MALHAIGPAGESGRCVFILLECVKNWAAARINRCQVNPGRAWSPCHRDIIAEIECAWSVGTGVFAMRTGLRENQRLRGNRDPEYFEQRTQVAAARFEPEAGLAGIQLLLQQAYWITEAVPVFVMNDPFLRLTKSRLLLGKDRSPSFEDEDEEGNNKELQSQ